jgi:3-oxoadipate enol-lactonase
MTDTATSGIVLHHRIDGPADAPWLVLSNSLGTDLSLWDRQMPALARCFRVLRYDARGHGRSPVTPGPYTVALLGQDVVDLMDQLNIARAHFCGLSLGGNVGIWLGAHAPGRVEKLVLANTAAQIPPPERWNERIDAVRRGGMAAIVEGVLTRWLTPGFRERDPAGAQAARAMLLAAPPEGYCASCAAIRDNNQHADLASIHVPTLVIAGSADPATPPAMGRVLAQGIAGARMIELPAAHLSNLEAPEAFTAAVLEFLNT